MTKDLPCIEVEETDLTYDFVTKRRRYFIRGDTLKKCEDTLNRVKKK